MSEQKKWAKYALAVALMLILGYLGYLGYDYVQPDPPGDIIARAIKGTQFRTVNIDHDIDVDGTSNFDVVDIDDTLTVDGGLTNFGGGTYATADGDNDVGIDGDLEVNGATDLDGTVAIAGVMTGVDDLEHIFFPTVASTAFTYTASAGGTVVLFTQAAGEIWLIHDIFVNVTANWDCTGDDCTVKIGDDGDVDGLCDLADAELQTADTEYTGTEAGWQCFGSDTVGAFVASGNSMIYAAGAGQTIDAVLAAAGDDFAAGAATAYIVYTRIQ